MARLRYPAKPRKTWDCPKLLRSNKASMNHHFPKQWLSSPGDGFEPFSTYVTRVGSQRVVARGSTSGISIFSLCLFGETYELPSLPDRHWLSQLIFLLLLLLLLLLNPFLSLSISLDLMKHHSGATSHRGHASAHASPDQVRFGGHKSPRWRGFRQAKYGTHLHWDSTWSKWTSIADFGSFRQGPWGSETIVSTETPQQGVD